MQFIQSVPVAEVLDTEGSIQVQYQFYTFTQFMNVLLLTEYSFYEEYTEIK
jgi:hypothetical protein